MILTEPKQLLLHLISGSAEGYCQNQFEQKFDSKWGQQGAKTQKFLCTILECVVRCTASCLDIRTARPAVGQHDVITGTTFTVLLAVD